MGPRHRRVVWSEGASRELDETIEYIAGESLKTAIHLLMRLLDAANSLTGLSERGRTVPERGDPAIRELLVDPYRLIYVLGESEVVILGVVHQRRDFDRWGRADGSPVVNRTQDG